MAFNIVFGLLRRIGAGFRGIGAGLGGIDMSLHRTRAGLWRIGAGLRRIGASLRRIEAGLCSLISQSECDNGESVNLRFNLGLSVQSQMCYALSQSFSLSLQRITSATLCWLRIEKILCSQLTSRVLQEPVAFDATSI